MVSLERPVMVAEKVSISVMPVWVILGIRPLNCSASSTSLHICCKVWLKRRLKRKSPVTNTTRPGSKLTITMPKTAGSVRIFAFSLSGRPKNEQAQRTITGNTAMSTAPGSAAFAMARKKVRLFLFGFDIIPNIISYATGMRRKQK